MKLGVNIAAVVILATLASACTTTQEAQQVLQSRWVGQPADAFFMRYGAPASSYRMANGGQLYTWRGGDKERYIAPVYAAGSAKTTTVTSSDGRQVTIETPGQQRMVSGPRTETLFCEIEIAATPDNRIAALRASNDTPGDGITSLSRCAEVLDAELK